MRTLFAIKTVVRQSLAVMVCAALLVPQGLPVSVWSAEAVATMSGLAVSDDAVTIKLSGPVKYNGFLVANPPKLVVELFDVSNKVGVREIRGRGKFLKRVRAAQYQTVPRMVSRVVLDLSEMAGYRIVESGDSLVVQLAGEPSAPSAASAAPTAAVDASTPAAAAPEPRARPKIAVPPAAAPSDNPELLGMAGVKAAKPEAKAAAGRDEAPSARRAARARARAADILARLPRDLVTLDFDNTDIRDVLRLLAAKAKVNLIFGSDVSLVPPLTLHLSDVPFNEAMQTILSMTGLVTSQVGDNILRVMTPAQLTKERTVATAITKVIPLNYSKAADIMMAVNAVRTAEGRTGTASADQKTNSLIITESPDSMAATERLIAQLDIQPKQVLIEAKLVEVNLTNSLHYGIQWDYLSIDTGKALGKEGTTSVGSPIGLPDPFQNPHTGQGMDRNSLNFPGASDQGGVGASGRGSGVGLPANVIFGALTLGRITNNYLLNVTLSAAAAAGKVKVLSDPKIATLNNQPANINVTTQYPYVTSSVTSTGVATQAVAYVTVGIKLTVTPTINADGRITLDINPDISQPSATAAASATGAPGVDARTAQTTVLVRDGETIVIGGLISDSTSNQIAKIPILGDIPILGWLFRKKSVVRTRSELLIFVTPKVLPD
ncbi:MAG: type IV pilus secretin PilQ [Elusimicrobia bacterium]|nr:type IV pilus secretin PilQ [Elusimicrobiota bacterium]